MSKPILTIFFTLIFSLYAGLVHPQEPGTDAPPETRVIQILKNLVTELDKDSDEAFQQTVSKMEVNAVERFAVAFQEDKLRNQVEKSLTVAFRLRDYVSSPAGASVLGDKQEVAVESITEIIKEITKLGSTLSESDFEKIRNNANKAALDKPITGVFEFPAAEKSGGLFGKVTGAVGTVTDVPGSAIGGFTDIASGGLSGSIDKAVIVADNYPAKVQKHILNDDATTTVVLSIEQFATNTEDLPERIAEAVVKVLQDTGEQQPEIRMTLDSVNKNLVTVDNIVTSAEGLTAEASKTTENAEPLVREIKNLMSEMNESARLAQEKLEFEVENMEKIPQPEPVDLAEINTLIQSSTQTVSELRQTVEQLRMMTDEGSLSEGTILIGDEVEGLVEKTKSSIMAIIFQIMFAIIAIIVVWYFMTGLLAWYKLKVLKVELKIQHEAKSQDQIKKS